MLHAFGVRTRGWTAIACAAFVSSPALGACDHGVDPRDRKGETFADAGSFEADAVVAVDAAPDAGIGDGQVDSTLDVGAPDFGSFVHVDAGTLVSGDGSAFLVRAIDVGDWLVPEGYMWQFDGPRGDRARRIEARVTELIGTVKADAFWKTWRDTFITESDVARMNVLGFNTIRVATSARLLMREADGTFDDAGFAYLENLVTWSKAHDVHVIFDMHAAPGGQTGTNIDDDANDQPELFTVPQNQTRLIALWTEIARRFTASTAVLGYDLLNEPIAPDFAAHNAELWPLYTRIGQAIRAVDPHHVLIVEGAQWGNDWSSLAAPFDPQTMYSFHKYWDDPTLASIQPFLDKGATWKMPLWVGETGENDDTWYKTIFPIFEASHVGWGFWSWKKMESDNNPYAVPAPAGWPAIQSYVKDPTMKPSAAAAGATFDALLANIPLAACRYNAHAVCAVLPCP
jgi:endoglucanase